MRSSYREEDVILLLKDITGRITPEPTAVREQKIQNGTHYCEMLPIEYTPSAEYMEAYEQALRVFALPTARAIGVLADRIAERRGRDVVLVSLARAGIPIGILLKWYFSYKYRWDVPHYAISIIRGRGIDTNALDTIISHHGAASILFVDGWIGKGAILGELECALKDYPEVSAELAVAADPANMTALCGTHADILIPSSCLNCTVSGLISRTVLRPDLIGSGDYHGAVYYGEWKEHDLSYAFLEAIASRFSLENAEDSVQLTHPGLTEVTEIMAHYGITDINRVKPGIGETTRVLLRRVPWKVLVSETCMGDEALEHILRLAKEKQVPVETYPLQNYKACGLIRKVADT